MTRLTANMDASILSGNKVIEIRPTSANKGKVTLSWILKDNRDFILAAGDDTTDEDLFAALPANAHSIKVSFGGSKARLNLAAPLRMVELPKKLEEQSA